MNAVALVFSTLVFAQAQTQARVQTHEPARGTVPLPPLRVVTPFAHADVEKLGLWFDAHSTQLGVRCRVERAERLGSAELLPDTLLFGFEAGLLLDLGGDGALLADAAHVERAVHPIATEAWTLAWSRAGDGGPPEFDSYRMLLDRRFKDRVHLRQATLVGPEGLVLSEIRARLRVDLEEIAVAFQAPATVLPSDLPFDELLNTLSEGGVTVVPLRAAVFARRSGLPIREARPREGRVGLTLAAALTRASGSASAAVVDERLDAKLLADLCRTLELEPVGAAGETFPDWIREAGRHHQEDAIHRERAGMEREHLVKASSGATPAVEPPQGDWLDDLLNGLLVTIAAVLIFVALRRVGRTR